MGTEKKFLARPQKRTEFEKKYLEELFIFMRINPVVVIEKLDEVLKKVRTDCE